ncbi:MAG: molecular chaperone HtpG [Clostridia bacterium]|nr:molecular chaperone HtpG [Clostridia bacterium]
MSENVKKGGISVDSEHLFPIIKKWLYSDKDIFLREIVSNGCDAVTKLKRLDSLGEISLPEQDYRIDVVLDKTAGTLTVTDNGIGMTADELERYICNIALSGAVEFIQKYEKDESGKPQEGIIGHFGLGFYSSFMVSQTVTVESKSYTGAPAVKWVCDSEGEYETFPSEREERGTSVIMKISDDEKELLDASKIREILEKYCSFMSVPVFFSEEAEAESENDKEKEPEQINDTKPLWMKSPSECTDDEYKAFYKKVFHDYRDPLFWVHINAEYPLNFKGIIYFPKLNAEFEPIEGQVKLYYNQVFVADNIKEVIPDYLLMLRGVLDCPELPLNVSRSYLQNNGYVTKIAAHIVKKAADKLNGMFNTDRENYEKVYEDIKIFVEYGCIRDKKFYDRVKGSVLFRSALTDKNLTLDEYLEGAKEKHENKVFYAADKKTQAQYISMYADQGVEVLLLDRPLDTQFIQTIEMDRGGVSFIRVDSDIDEVLKNGEAQEDEKLTELFRKASGKDDLEVGFAALKDEKTPAVLNEDEHERRFGDLMRLYRMDGADDLPGKAKLIVNTSSPLYRKTGELIAAGEEEKAGRLCRSVYSLATLAHRQLTADELKAFLQDQYDLLAGL